MRTSFISARLAAAAVTLTLLAAPASFASEPSRESAPAELPAILRTIESQGVKVLGEMKVPGGLRAFAAKAGSQPIAIYLTPDNQHVVVGTLVDAAGQDMASDQLKELTEKPVMEDGWKQLEAATWVADGKDDAPRVVYTFTDPNCPYCNKFWKAARPWVDSGKVQLRHVIVGVIRQDSPAKAAAILEAEAPSEALTENELKHDEGGIAPKASMTEKTKAGLDNNANLMTDLGFGGTPAVIFKKTDGSVGTVAGLPDNGALEMILGAR